MRYYLVVSCLLALTACQQTPEQIAAQGAQDDATCQSYGAKQGTDAYVNCRTQMATEHQQEAGNERRLRRAMLFTAGQNLMNQPPPPRPVSCTSSAMGGFVTTNCY